jgi:hypothetical protein
MSGSYNTTKNSQNRGIVTTKLRLLRKEVITAGKLLIFVLFYDVTNTKTMVFCHKYGYFIPLFAFFYKNYAVLSHLFAQAEKWQ